MGYCIKYVVYLCKLVKNASSLESLHYLLFFFCIIMILSLLYTYSLLFNTTCCRIHTKAALSLSLPLDLSQIQSSFLSKGQGKEVGVRRAWGLLCMRARIRAYAKRLAFRVGSGPKKEICPIRCQQSPQIVY